MLRTSPELHQQLSKRAHDSGQSLNQTCVKLIENALQNKEQESAWEKSLRKVLPQVQKHFGEQALAVAVFGSQVRGDASQSSDIDVLIVLKSETPITRSLYQWWDSHIQVQSPYPVNPHFMHIPKDPASASGIWFEIALSHKIIYEKTQQLTPFLRKILQLVENGSMRREWSYGHPYWVRSAS